jgi:hypothetical protein
MEPTDREEAFNIQKEMLELAIKAGRRAVHDFDHLLNEAKLDPTIREEFQQRVTMWKEIFYPDKGPKNYRSTLHQEIINLQFRLSRAHQLLKEHGIDPEPHFPF